LLFGRSPTITSCLTIRLATARNQPNRKFHDAVDPKTPSRDGQAVRGAQHERGAQMGGERVGPIVPCGIRSA
jgi:hypothetical protein